MQVDITRQSFTTHPLAPYAASTPGRAAPRPLAASLTITASTHPPRTTLRDAIDALNRYAASGTGAARWGEHRARAAENDAASAMHAIGATRTANGWTSTARHIALIATVARAARHAEHEPSAGSRGLSNADRACAHGHWDRARIWMDTHTEEEKTREQVREALHSSHAATLDHARLRVQHWPDTARALLAHIDECAIAGAGDEIRAVTAILDNAGSARARASINGLARKDDSHRSTRARRLTRSTQHYANAQRHAQIPAAVDQFVRMYLDLANAHTALANGDGATPDTPIAAAEEAAATLGANIAASATHATIDAEGTIRIGADERTIAEALAAARARPHPPTPGTRQGSDTLIARAGETPRLAQAPESIHARARHALLHAMGLGAGADAEGAARSLIAAAGRMPGGRLASPAATARHTLEQLARRAREAIRADRSRAPIASAVAALHRHIEAHGLEGCAWREIDVLLRTHIEHAQRAARTIVLKPSARAPGTARSAAGTARTSAEAEGEPPRRTPAH